MSQPNHKSPATVFLRLSMFNLLGSLIFLIFYFLYHFNGGERSYFLLLASGAGLVAAAGSLFAYRYFKAKIGG